MRRVATHIEHPHLNVASALIPIWPPSISSYTDGFYRAANGRVARRRPILSTDGRHQRWPGASRPSQPAWPPPMMTSSLSAVYISVEFLMLCPYEVIYLSEAWFVDLSQSHYRHVMSSSSQALPIGSNRSPASLSRWRRGLFSGIALFMRYGALLIMALLSSFYVPWTVLAR